MLQYCLIQPPLLNPNFFPVEFLNTLNPNGMPPHCLALKQGMPLMILRNLDLKNGLSNGTRVILRRLLPNSLQVEIIRCFYAKGRSFGFGLGSTYDESMHHVED